MNDELLDLKIVRIDRIYRGLTPATIRQWLAERRVLPDDLVRPVGAEAWMKVSLAPELAPPPVAPVALPPIAGPPLAARPAPLPAKPQPAAALPVLPPAQRASAVAAPARPATPPAAASRAAVAPSAALAADDDLGIPEPAMSRPRKKRRPVEDSEMDMTPMIDVTFQLLIFFMLSNQLANPAPVEVPLAKFGKGITPDGKQSILMDEAGRYYLSDKIDPTSVEPSLDGLIDQVSGNAGAAPGPLEVIISAHKNGKHQPIRELLERLGEVPNLGPVHLGVEEMQ